MLAFLTFGFFMEFISALRSGTSSTNSLASKNGEVV
jgi:hypothetical protein